MSEELSCCNSGYYEAREYDPVRNRYYLVCTECGTLLEWCTEEKE